MRRIDAFGVLGMAAFAVGLALTVADAQGDGTEIGVESAPTVVILLVSGGTIAFTIWWICIQDWKGNPC